MQESADDQWQPPEVTEEQEQQAKEALFTKLKQWLQPEEKAKTAPFTLDHFTVECCVRPINVLFKKQPHMLSLSMGQQDARQYDQLFLLEQREVQFSLPHATHTVNKLDARNRQTIATILVRQGFGWWGRTDDFIDEKVSAPTGEGERRRRIIRRRQEHLRSFFEAIVAGKLLLPEKTSSVHMTRARRMPESSQCPIVDPQTHERLHRQYTAAQEALLHSFRQGLSPKEQHLVRRFQPHQLDLTLWNPTSSLEEHGCCVSMQLQKYNAIPYSHIRFAHAVEISCGTEEDRFGALGTAVQINGLKAEHRSSIAEALILRSLEDIENERALQMSELCDVEKDARDEHIDAIEWAYTYRKNNVLMRAQIIREGRLCEQ